MNYAADDADAIAKRLKELEAEKLVRVTGETLPEFVEAVWPAYGTAGHDYDPA